MWVAPRTHLSRTETTKANPGVRRPASRRRVRLLLNIIWLVLAGTWLAISYVIAGVLLAITIIGIPFAAQVFKLAGYALWPFGRVLARTTTRHTGLRARRQHPVVSVGRLVARARASGCRSALVHHDHRHPARCRQLQDGRRGPRPVWPRSRRDRRSHAGTGWVDLRRLARAKRSHPPEGVPRGSAPQVA